MLLRAPRSSRGLDTQKCIFSYFLALGMKTNPRQIKKKKKFQGQIFFLQISRGRLYIFSIFRDRYFFQKVHPPPLPRQIYFPRDRLFFPYIERQIIYFFNFQRHNFFLQNVHPPPPPRHPMIATLSSSIRLCSCSYSFPSICICRFRASWSSRRFRFSACRWPISFRISSQIA